RSAKVYEDMTRLRADPNPQSPFGRDAEPKGPTPASVADGFTIAAGGDLLGLRQPVAVDRNPAFRRVIDIFRNADAGFANLEANVFDPGGLKGRGGGPLHAADVADQLDTLGLTLL